MKIQEKDNKKVIILDENESVSLVATGKRQTNGISVTNIDGRMDVKADPAAINSLNDNPNSILEKCDRWFDAFVKVHDMFRKLALSDRCKKMRINMQVAVSQYVNVKKDNDMGKCIDIDLKRYRDRIQDGPSLEIPQENEDVFKYMLVRVMDYYLAKNFGKIMVDLPNNWDYTLYSPDHVEYEEVFPLELKLSILRNLPEYQELIRMVIYKFNLGLPIKPMIEELKNKIVDSGPVTHIDDSVEYSERQWNQLSDISGSFLK